MAPASVTPNYIPNSIKWKQTAAVTIKKKRFEADWFCFMREKSDRLIPICDPVLKMHPDKKNAEERYQLELIEIHLTNV